jgi:hypothetical protein
MAITINGKPGVTQITELTVGSSADLASVISDESGTGVLAFTNTPTFTTPVLGTASATAIELGHASDTTIARVSSGVVSIEGVNIVTTSSTDTLTNKTLTSPVLTTPSISNINAAGDLIVGTADNTIGIVSIGTVDQVLTSNGTTATWVTPAAGTTANDQAFAFAVQVFA